MLFNQSPTPVSISRNYQYDKSGELSQINDSRHGITRYQYDALGRITETQAANKSLNERFAFDPAHNLISEEDQQQGKVLKDNKLNEYQNKRYQYDSFGNMTEKLTKESKMRFSYDAEHQMQTAEVYKNGVEQQYQYAYDPFGRRISKTDAFNTTHFIWDGNRLLTEIRGKQSKTFVYEQDGFVPVAQVTQENEIQHYHTDHLGTPRELTNQAGEITWEATYQTWGNTVKVSYQEIEVDNELAPAVQPLRFQGQYFDEETGLHYNRFRYYDPDVGRFVSQDPIGLLGGDNLYQYASNPIQWIDPLGLSSAVLDKALGGRVGDCKAAHHLIPEEMWKKHKSFLDSIGMEGMRDKASNGVLMPSKGTAGAISHTGSHSVYSAMVSTRITAIERANMTPEKSKEAIQSLQKSLRREIKAKSPRIKTKASKTSSCKLA